MRITENSLNRTYIKNLQRNLSDLSSSNLKLASGRKYNHVSEDTGNAARAFVVRDQISKNEEYINTVESAIGELNTADDNIMTVSSVLKTVYERVVSAGSGTKSQEDLNVIAEELKGLKNEIIQTMNARYGDKFLFAGSNNDEPPFTVDDTGKIFFNGVAVDDAKSTTDFNENKVVYLDIGFGMSSRPGGINAQTGLKISTSGVDALGYGVDANGEPNNICSLISKIEEQLRSGDVQGAGDTMKHLKKSEENLSACIAEMGVTPELLENIEQTEKELEVITRTLEEYKKGIAYLSEKLLAGTITEEQKQKLNTLKIQEPVNKMRFEKLKAQAEEMKRRQREVGKSRLIAETVYPGVSIHIGDAVMQISQQEYQCMFYSMDGKIQKGMK